MSDTIEMHHEVTLDVLNAEINELTAKLDALREALHHQRIHHKAEISVIEDTHARRKSTMLANVQHAQHALGKSKTNVVAYKLDVLAEMLGSE